MYLSYTEESVKDLFSINFLLRVVVATMAFELGVEFPNVRQVVVCGLPSILEYFVQETGRTGQHCLPA